MKYMLLASVGLQAVLSDFILRVGEEQCTQCCNAANDQFQGDFSLSTCLSDGCFRDPGAGQRCIDIFGTDVTDLDRKGCEVGRDFLTAGFTSVLSDDLLLCSNGALEVFVLDDLRPDLVVNATDCRTCCDNANSQFDNGQGNLVDDFGAAACRGACNDLVTCFDEGSYRERTGCLTALDFRNQTITTMELGIVQCNAGGSVTLLDFTDFPTTSPTKSPTKSPTSRPTAFPTPPTKSPTTFPTRSPVIGGDDEPGLDFNTIILVVGGLGGGCGVLACIAFAFILGRRQAEIRDHGEAEMRKKTLEIKHHLGDDYSDFSTMHSPTNFGDAGSMVQISIPASEFAKKDFTLSRFMPKKKTSTTSLHEYLAQEEQNREVDRSRPRYMMAQSTSLDNNEEILQFGTHRTKKTHQTTQTKPSKPKALPKPAPPEDDSPFDLDSLLAPSGSYADFKSQSKTVATVDKSTAKKRGRNQRETENTLDHEPWGLESRTLSF